MKKKLCALLAALLVMTSTVPALAEGTQQEDTAQPEIVTEAEEKSFFDKELQPQSDEEISEEAMEDTEEFIDSLPVTEEYSEEQELPEEETTLSEDEKYLLNVILFSLDENTALSAVKSKLRGLGLREITPVFTDEDGNPQPIGNKNETWFRAYTGEDAGEITEKLTEINGVANAEPEYIYTPDSVGEPNETERNRGWIYGALLKNDTGFWWNMIGNHDYDPGAGTVVAVIDTGVDYTHEDLNANMWVNEAELNGKPGVDDDGNGVIDDIYGMNATATGQNAGNPMDDHGHGTHVAGIIAMTPNLTGSVGLAYGSRIMAIKAGQSTGSFSSSHIAKAINYAVQNGADVINMSFGGTGRSNLVEQALEEAFTKCVLVASAGNDGQPTEDAPEDQYPKKEDIYPAAYSYVLGVMATDQSGKLASFSNWDYSPNENAEYELTAPGVNIYSTLPGNRYASWSGTSMAAPCVSAAAAILRSHYSDKDTYSSRFIMGQLSSATKDRTSYISSDGKFYSYAALNIYDSATYMPKPNITIKDAFLLDTESGTDTILNDGDGIIDAGETIDLGVLVRNQWGLTGNITVKADAISDGGVPNPYITFVNDTVTLSPAGTFQEVDNGFVYDDSLLVSVSDPIRFTVASDIPNDTQICLNITASTTNGADENDHATYTLPETYRLTFRVSAGRGVRGTISQDTTWTKDTLWIVEDGVMIAEGATLTIEPGTKVQFYSSDYEGVYEKKATPYINCNGTLNAIGTADEPIEMYPGAGYENYAVHIYSGEETGKTTLQYCNITNPMLGGYGQYGSHRGSPITLVDHCALVQNSDPVYHRYVDAGVVKEYYPVYWHIDELSNTSLTSIKFGYNHSKEYSKKGNLYCDKVTNCLFDDCYFALLGKARGTNVGSDFDTVVTNSTFANNDVRWEEARCYDEEPVIFSDVYTYDGANSYYVRASFPYGLAPDQTLRYQYYQEIAAELGGALTSINSQEERNALYRKFSNATIGMRYDKEAGCYKWDDETNNYALGIPDSTDSEKNVFVRLYGYNSECCYASASVVDALLEFPKSSVTLEELQKKLDTYVPSKALLENLCEAKSNFTRNAVLNPVLNTDPTTWTNLLAAEYTAGYKGYAPKNYWGTENAVLIDKMITDGHDYPGTYLELETDPILTTASPELENIYPFVAKLEIWEENGELPVTTISPSTDYEVRVIFNRDMDTTVTPSVTYGGEDPYTDYSVSNGKWVDSKTWAGTFRVSPVHTGGKMYWRVKGGVAKSDKWLVCGTDIERFSFTVSQIGALSMVLTATGGANKIDLTWAQNDYDTLAGYNLYRCKTETGNYTKLNTALLSDTRYTDTDVKPGETYYYYFKVVNTAGVEEGNASNTANAAPLDNIDPVLTHTPVKDRKGGSQITISATATDNIGVTAVKLYYRKSGETGYTQSAMTTGVTTNLYVGTIPAAVVTSAGVEYYITAEDADGNIVYSGTAAQPHIITIDTKPYITGITPTSDVIAGGKLITILGGNFTSDLVLKLGGTVITNKTLENDGKITFTAPQMPSGTYAVTLTTSGGTVVNAPTTFTYTDSNSIAEIPTTMEMECEKNYSIPLYITSGGEVISLHAEIDLPTESFTYVKVEKADKTANYNLQSSFSSGTLTISCAASSDIRPSTGALLNIIVKPKVTNTMQADVTLHDVQLNGAAVSKTISGKATFVTNYSLSALVNYYTGTNKHVEGVTISAGGVSDQTDANGAVSFNVKTKNVTVFAEKNRDVEGAVTAYDASLVLQSIVGATTLTENQQKAADVDGNGTVNEHDAALILQKTVKKLDTFPVGKTWIFVPESKEMTLNAQYPNLNKATFTAILVGDVDGSYGTAE